MQDLCSGSLTLESFKAVVFVGGFSYADVLGSAKGKKTPIHTHTLIGRFNIRVGYRNPTQTVVFGPG